MPTGDPVPNVPPTHHPRESLLSDAQLNSPLPAAGKPRTMTPKSSAITARTKYVSPYRQTTTNRSVSTPVARTNAPNAGSPNFKDIVNRFNVKNDEKIPVPTNRIPAVTAGNASLRSRKNQQSRLHGGDSRVSKPRSASTTGGYRQTSRSNSAQGSHPPTSNPKHGRQSRSRRPSTSLSNGSDGVPRSNKSLHPLQTSFKKGKAKDAEYRRSLSALETHSPSAASLADNESEGTELFFRRPLQHRRSHSNIEVSSSPVTYIQVDADLSKFSPSGMTSPRSPPLGRSGIPISTRAGGGRRQTSTEHSSDVSRVLVSPHGSRRTPQPMKSPNLKAYISAPKAKQSPPLRSSRQRLPATANTSTHASRQRLQNSTPGSLKESRYKIEGTKRKEHKRKIPEIGNVDFAARRAQIQSAFTQSLKESDERKEKVGQKSDSKSSPPADPELVEDVAQEKDERRSAEEDAAQDNDERSDAEEMVREEDDSDNSQTLGDIIAVLPGAYPVSDEHRAPTPRPTKEPIAISSLTNPTQEDMQEDMITPIETGDEDMQEIVRKLRYSMALESVKIDGSESSPTEDIENHPMFVNSAVTVEDSCLKKGSLDSENDFPESSVQEHFAAPETEDETEETVEKAESSKSKRSSTEVDIHTPLTTAWKRHSMGERPESRPISVIITPETHTQSTVLSQVSNLLRASPIEWSTDSDMSPNSPVLRRPHDAIIFNVEPPAPENTAPELQNGHTLHDPEIESESEQYYKSFHHCQDGKDKEVEGLSPLVSTMMSDDRATIASVFDRYDEPREDFLNSYQDPETEKELEIDASHTTSGERNTCDGNDTEMDDPLHLERQDPEDEEDEDTGTCTSCSEAPMSGLLSVDDQSGDDWLTEAEVDVSPLSRDADSFSRNPIERSESPTTPRQTSEFQSPLPPTPPHQTSIFQSPSPPTPPPKDEPPPLPEKDLPLSKTNSPNPAAMPITPTPKVEYQSTSSYLPEIDLDSEPLGLAIQSLPSHYDFRADERPSSYHTEQYYARGNTDRKCSYESSRASADQHSGHRPSVDQHSGHRPSVDQHSGHRPSVDQHSSHRPSVDQQSTFRDRFSPSANFYVEAGEFGQISALAGPDGHNGSEIPPKPVTASRVSASIHSAEADTNQSAKLFKRRRHLLMEIVDTESAFFRDMTVAEEIYKGSANACSSITQDDIKVLFGNTDAVVHFSKTFLEVLKAAVASVYTMRRSGSGINSSAASVANSANSDDLSGEKHLTEEEKDQKTYVGEAFAEMMFRMEKVYGDYCKNHDSAVARLGKIENNRGIAIWLQECKVCAEDLTNAWNLESLLIKPVQRVLKYPLLLTQLLECTPTHHPDYGPLEVAAKEMKFVADRINEMKKRKDMVEKIVGRKRNETDIRHGITKGFARRAEKLRQSVGLSEVVVDEKYNRLFENYNMHFVQVQVIARDVEIYVADIQGHVEKFIGFTHNFREYAEIVLTQHVETEMKWRKFDNAMKETANTYLQEHRHRVRKHVIEPLETLLKMHESPQVIMTKRNKKAVDYARFKAIKDRGDTPDKKTTEMAEAYTALNETLIDELPKLFALTKKLVDAVLLNFIDLQAQWMNSWASKIRMTFMEMDIPDSIGNIVQTFAGDFSYNEQILKQLSICNGSLNAVQFPSIQFYSPATTNLSLETFDLRRPRTADDRNALSPTNGRERAMSLNSQSPTVATFDKDSRFEKDSRRHSGGPALSSPLSLMAPVIPLPPLLAPSNNRPRSSSVVASVSPPAKVVPQRSNSSNLHDSHLPQHSFHRLDNRIERNRPHTSRAATAAASLPVLNFDRNSRASSPEPALPSAAFSSAMPMEDDRASKYSSAMPMEDDRALQSHPPSRTTSRSPSRAPSRSGSTKAWDASNATRTDKAMFIAASLYAFNIDKQRREAGFPYLTYVQGEIFDVIGVKGDIWLARNQDDKQKEIGWIWCKHFARISEG